ncbi:MAG: toll/interleukin-1 receptor domain-containing protein [Cyanobacteriota bacterium]|nr:toll/interleukin-1 receptor domain-containing protein [Cyanobacteriota bacterium]
MRIFISYSRHNSDFAKILEMRLSQHGCTVWLDTEKLRLGQFWREEIVQAIAACDYFVILLSTRSIRSENVVKELSLAEGSSKRILPVMIEQVDIPDTMKYQLAGLQFVVVDSEQVDQGIAALLAALPTVAARGKPQVPAESTSPAEAAPSAEAWDKTRLQEQLTLNIGPIARLLLESLPDPLRARERAELQTLFRDQNLDLNLLATALDRSRLSADASQNHGRSPALPDEASLVEWLRLQVGPIASVIWDTSLRQALRQAPQRARDRLEQLGVAPEVVEELLSRCNGDLNNSPTSHPPAVPPCAAGPAAAQPNAQE